MVGPLPALPVTGAAGFTSLESEAGCVDGAEVGRRVVGAAAEAHVARADDDRGRGADQGDPLLTGLRASAAPEVLIPEQRAVAPGVQVGAVLVAGLVLVDVAPVDEAVALPGDRVEGAHVLHLEDAAVAGPLLRPGPLLALKAPRVLVADAELLQAGRVDGHVEDDGVDAVARDLVAVGPIVVHLELVRHAVAEEDADARVLDLRLLVDPADEEHGLAGLVGGPEEAVERAAGAALAARVEVDGEDQPDLGRIRAALRLVEASHLAELGVEGGGGQVGDAVAGVVDRVAEGVLLHQPVGRERVTVHGRGDHDVVGGVEHWQVEEAGQGVAGERIAPGDDPLHHVQQLLRRQLPRRGRGGRRVEGRPDLLAGTLAGDRVVVGARVEHRQALPGGAQVGLDDQRLGHVARVEVGAAHLRLGAQEGHQRAELQVAGPRLGPQHGVLARVEPDLVAAGGGEDLEGLQRLAGAVDHLELLGTDALPGGGAGDLGGRRLEGLVWQAGEEVLEPAAGEGREQHDAYGNELAHHHATSKVALERQTFQTWS